MPDTLERLTEAALVAVLRTSTAEQIAPTVDALVAGGIGAVEITYTSPEADAGIAAARARHPGLLLGAGTVRSVGQVEDAVEADADFLISPHLDPEVFAAMLDSGRLALPGVFTPTEVAAALDLGAEALKLFPAVIGGIAHLKALRGPFPEVRLVPTGGVNAENLNQWLEAGAPAVGVGGELCRRDLIDAGDYDGITALAQEFVAALGERGAR